MTHKTFRLRHPSRGAALIMSLVILLVLTVLGISAMKSTGQQENIVSNLRDHNLAFYAANSALAYAEGKLSTSASPPGANQSEPYGTIYSANVFVKNNILSSASETLSGTAYNSNVWGTPSSPSQYATQYPYKLANVINEPSYIIQLIQYECPPSTNSRATGKCRFAYRITARGFGETVNSRVLLQATYILQGYG